MIRKEKLYCGGSGDCPAGQTCVGGVCKEKVGPTKPPIADPTPEQIES